MLTLMQLTHIRDLKLACAERAAVWREASEIRSTQADAEQVVGFLQGVHDHNPERVAAAREINKYLDQVAHHIEHKNRAIASLEDDIDELRVKIKGRDEGLARLQGEVVTLQGQVNKPQDRSTSAVAMQAELVRELNARIEGIQADLAENEASSDVEIAGLRQQLTAANEERESLKEENNKIRTTLSLGGSEAQQLRLAIRQLEGRISELQTQLNNAEEANAKFKEEKDMPTEGLTPVPGLQYAVRDVEAAQPTPLSEDLERATQDLQRINDNLRMELSDAKYARDQIKATREGMVREYEAVVRESRELRQSRDELLQAASLRAALSGEKAPSLRNVDAELHAITEAIPLFANLDPTACDRILNYLGNRFARRVLE